MAARPVAAIDSHNLTELEAKLICLSKTSENAIQQLLMFLSKESDIARAARVATPGKSLSAILQSLKAEGNLKNLRPLQWPDNEAKFFDKNKRLLSDIKIDVLDATPVCSILLNVPAYPTCKIPYKPNQSPIIHHQQAVCTNSTTCCSLCLNCFICNNNCQYAQMNVYLIRKLRNTTHMTPKEYYDIDVAISQDPNGPEAVRWNTFSNECANGILFITKCLHDEQFIDDVKYDNFQLEINMVKTLTKQVYFSHFFPNDAYNLTRQDFASTHSITLAVDIFSKQSRKLGIARDLNSREAMALQDQFELLAQDVLRNRLHLDPDDASCRITLNAFYFEEIKRNKNKVKATIHIKSSRYNIIPHCYESVNSEESTDLKYALTESIKDILKVLVEPNISVVCIGYKYSSIHFILEVTSDLPYNKEKIQKVLAESKVLEVLEKHGFADEEVTMSFAEEYPEELRRYEGMLHLEYVVIGFWICNTLEENIEEIDEKLPIIERDIYKMVHTKVSILFHMSKIEMCVFN